MSDSHVTPPSRSRFFDGKKVHIEKKEWGEEHWIVNKEYCGKKLMLKKDRRCSLHKHEEKDEVFYLQSGSVLLELGKEKRTLKPGDFVHVPAGVYHRFTGLKDSEIFEFSTHHEEDDSYRREYSGHADPVRFERQAKIVDAFPGLRVAVVGDVMLDVYTMGSVDRVSPEAPIPVVRARGRREVPGGAANVAMGLRAFGAAVELIGVCGDDEAGGCLTGILATHGIRTHLAVLKDRPTTRKERITASEGQQVVRVDMEVTDPIGPAAERRIIASLRTAAKAADALLISDYAKGALTPAVFAAAYAIGKERKIPVIVDPKPHGTSLLTWLRDATAITPNVAEARHLIGEHRMSEGEVGEALSKRIKGALVLTRGAHGIDVYRKGKLVSHADALSPEIVNVSGAGDTVAATVALVLAAGGSITDAADIGNRAASVAVQKRGTAVVSGEEVREAL